MNKCIDCNFMGRVCMLDGQEKNRNELDIDQDKCEILISYRKRTPIISFNGQVSVENKIYPINISRDSNKLILEFAGNEVPAEVLSKKCFNISRFLTESEDEVDCFSDCGKCITPIC